MWFVLYEDDKTIVSDDLIVKPALTPAFPTRQEALDNCLMKQYYRKDSENKSKRMAQLLELGAVVRKSYMNVETGSVADYDGWYYMNEKDEKVNAVDLGEVVEVKRDSSDTWIEVK